MLNVIFFILNYHLKKRGKMKLLPFHEVLVQYSVFDVSDSCFWTI